MTDTIDELNSKFEKKRREFTAPKQRSESKDGQKRKRALSSLSALERQDFVRRFFVLLEKDEERQRRTNSEDERLAAIASLREDLAAYEAGPAVMDWQGLLGEEFEAQSIECDDATIADDMADWLKRAHVLSKTRTLVALGGDKREPEFPLFKDLSAFSPLAEADGSQCTVGELCEVFTEQKRSAGAKPATMKSYNLPIQVLEEFLSPSRSIASVKYEDARRVADFLRMIPVHADKYYPNLPLAHAAKKEEQAKPPHGTLSPKRQLDVFTTIKGIFRYAVDREWLDKNPFGSKTLIDRLTQLEDSEKQQITGAELTVLLSSPDFLRERNRRGGEGKRHEGRFWAVLLCAFHGFRANEAAQLLVSDVRGKEGIDFLNISETNEAGEKVKALKTKVSRREIPLHRELVRIGFLEFVKDQRQRDPSGRLFPEFTPNSIGNRASSLSKWFGRLREKILGEQAKMGDKSLHSLRHAFTDAMRRISCSDEIRHELGGWSQKKQNSMRDYGEGYSLAKLKEVMDQIEFPGFDPSFLYPPARGGSKE